MNALAVIFVMRLLTLNCQRAMRPGLADYLRSTIKSGRYDFILLQEVDKSVRRILKHKHEYAVLGSLHAQGTEFVILHKRQYCAVQREFVSFQHLGPVKNEVGALIAVFRRGSKRYTICNAHFHWGRYLLQRKRAVRMLKERLLALPGVKILAGDFNTIFWREDEVLRRILSPQFRHAAYRGHTHDSAYLDEKYLFNLFQYAARIGIRFRSSIDHVYVSGSRIGHAVVHDVAVSDHRPLEVVLP